MFKKYIRQVVLPSIISCNWWSVVPRTVSDPKIDALLMNNK